MDPLRWLAVVLALGLAGACQPTGVARCDANLDALVLADAEGFRFDCTPEPLGEPPGVVGWADLQHRVLYVWPDRIASDRVLYKVMMHELGHAYRPGQGEAAADGWAWCHMSAAARAGISFLSKPTNCGPYFR